MKIALITGITGQDGSYLAELLLEKGYEVHGLSRRTSLNNTQRIAQILSKITLHQGDLSDCLSVFQVISTVKPDEIYNLAAQSDVKESFSSPEYACNVNGLGLLYIIEACRTLGVHAKIYQASTSELFGNTAEIPQNETTPFSPCSPYALAKQYAMGIACLYRQAYGMFIVNGILFNHESERRGEQFVTRKITRAAGRIAEGLQDDLELGNLDSMRDWGYAKDYVECMWKMLQIDHPDDYVVATGEQHSVREFVQKAFLANGIELRWIGEGIHEQGIDTATNKPVVKINAKYFRPAEVSNLLGNPDKAVNTLGWNPRKTSFDQLIQIMATNDRMLAIQEKESS